MFESPVDFNDSQTLPVLRVDCYQFESPVDFNDSQTAKMRKAFADGLRAL